MAAKESISPSFFKLDNAAKIYPAAKNRHWMALFRVSAELDEEIDPMLLSKALSRTLKRYPWLQCRLRRGLFWFCLSRYLGCPTFNRMFKTHVYPCV